MIVQPQHLSVHGRSPVVLPRTLRIIYTPELRPRNIDRLTSKCGSTLLRRLGPGQHSCVLPLASDTCNANIRLDVQALVLRVQRMSYQSDLSTPEAEEYAETDRSSC